MVFIVFDSGIWDFEEVVETKGRMILFPFKNFFLAFCSSLINGFLVLVNWIYFTCEFGTILSVICIMMEYCNDL